MTLRETKPWLFFTYTAKSLEGMISILPAMNPQVFQVDELNITELTSEKTGTRICVRLVDKNVLYCHGNAESSRYYSASGIDLDEFIREYELKRKIDAVIVCNPQRFRLSDHRIYLLGDAPGTSLYREHERLILEVTRVDGNPEIHL